MTKIKTSRKPKHEYLLIKTGYTSRIVPNGGCHEQFFERVYEDMTDKEKEEKDIELIFAFDDIWGQGLYEVGIDKHEVTRMIELTKKLKLFGYGIALFRCNHDKYRYITSAVQECTYCRTFDMETNIVYKTDNKCDPAIRYIEWDSESG